MTLTMCLRRFLMVKVYEVGEVYLDGKTPVPSYDEYKRLQEQLSEANGIIKYYAEKHGKLKACDYLNKWGVK